LKETILNLCKNKRNVNIENISFRDKQIGWKNYSFSLKYSELGLNGETKMNHFFELARNNIFIKGFLADLYLRPSCYACPAKCSKSGSDITIGDLWGAPSIIGQDDDDRGTSLVMINKDIPYLKNHLSLWVKEIDYCSALVYNPCIERSVGEPQKRTLFYSSIKGGYSFKKVVRKLTKVSFYDESIKLMKRIVKRIIRY
jgi:hypothetical protein